MQRERFCMDLAPRTDLRKICTGKAVCHKRFAFIYSKPWEILLHKCKRDLIQDFPAPFGALCYRLKVLLPVFGKNSLTGRFIGTYAEVKAFMAMKRKVKIPWVGRLRAKVRILIYNCIPLNPYTILQ